MARKYNIRHYARFLRIAKKDRDNQLRELRIRQVNRKIALFALVFLIFYLS